MIKKEIQNNQNSSGCKIIEPSDGAWRQAIINLVKSGEIDVDSANKCLVKLYDKTKKRE